MTATASAHPRARHRLEVSTLPPAAVFAGGLLLWLALGAARIWATDPLVVAVWATLGAFLVPVTFVLVMARRAPASIGTGALLRALVYGGITAAAVAGSAGALLELVTGGASLAPAALVGGAVLEEGAKLALVLVLARRFSPTVGTGLLLGGAVGAGYAAVGALGALLEARLALGSVALPPAAGSPIVLESGVALQHALLTPLGHPLWSALLAAVVLPVIASRGPWARVVLAGTGVVAAHAVATGGVTATAGLLGTGPVAVLAQVLVGAALAVPAVLAWRTVRLPAARESGARRAERVTADW